MRGVGGLNTHWLKMTPTLVTEFFLFGGGVGFDPPVPIQQDQHNVQMILKYGIFDSNFEDRKAYCIWLQEMTV